MQGSARAAMVLTTVLLTATAGCAQGVPTAPGSSGTAVTPSTSAPASAASASPAPTATMTPTSAPSSALTLGPQGYGALRLGMTKTQVRATGLVTGVSVDPVGTCGGPEDGSLVGVQPGPDESDVAGRLFFSATTNQLVAIYAGGGVRTPEGVGLGSTSQRLLAAYPTWRAQEPGPVEGRGRIQVPGNPEAHYRIVVTGGRVVELSIDSDRQDCYE